MAEDAGRALPWIVLVGLMGAGKSAVGRALAARLGLGFTDSDRAIEEAADRTIAEIFADYGEAFFRDRESEVLERLLGAAPGVLATGGGAFLSERNREAMQRAGAVTVWLEAPIDLLWARVRGRPHRPLLNRPDARAVLERLHAERAPIYALSDLTVMGDEGRSVQDTAAEVEAAVRAHIQGIPA